MTRVTLINADVLAGLAGLPDESVQCCVTSPPYWGLRDYGTPGQIGLEPTIEEFVAKMVEVFREVRRAMRKDGVLFLNLGDSYAANRSYQVVDNKYKDVGNKIGHKVTDGLKQKDMCGVPWRVALALQADGWWLRSDIIWAKPNPMPESCTDRPTKAHEYIFLLTKSAHYFWDAEAVSSPHKESSLQRYNYQYGKNVTIPKDGFCSAGSDTGWFKGGDIRDKIVNGRNIRTVWEIPTHSFPGSHFATFPPELVRRCVAAGSKEGDTILDPFSGAGTTALVAAKMGRDAIGIELNPEYVEMSRKRIAGELGMLCEVICE